MRTVERQVLGGLGCDRCGFTCDADDPEAHEFLCHEHEGAWGSVIGDGMIVRVDLCQRCVKEVLGPWLHIEPGAVNRQAQAVSAWSKELGGQADFSANTAKAD